MWSHSVFRDTGVPLLIVAPSGRISSANPAAQELVGRRSLTGTDLADLIMSPDRALLEAFLATIATLPAASSRTLGPVHVNWRGQSRQIHLVGSHARDPHGFDSLVVALQTIPESRRFPADELDPLTGAGTRDHGLQDLSIEVGSDAGGTVLLVDLDSFSDVNVRFGLSEGDRVLAEVAARLMRICPPGATVARFAGDVFLVVSPSTPIASAEQLGRLVLSGLAQPMPLAGGRAITASIGACGIAGENTDEVLLRAQSALAVAKEQGGQQVVIHGPELRTFGRRHADLEAERLIQVLESNVEAARAEARTDALTQVANRRSFDEEAPRLLARQRRSGSSLAALFIDLDEFGWINRSLGQHRGDRALRAVAGALAESCRAGDKLFRIGGEEFVVLLPDTDLVGSIAVAERLRVAVESAAIPHWGRADLPILTVSVGVAARLATEVTVTRLVHEANVQMREAKARGRNRVNPPLPDFPAGGQEGDSDVA